MQYVDNTGTKRPVQCVYEHDVADKTLAQ